MHVIKLVVQTRFHLSVVIRNQSTKQQHHTWWNTSTSINSHCSYWMLIGKSNLKRNFRTTAMH